MITFKHILCPVDFSQISINASNNASELADQFNADMIIMGTHGREGFAHMLLGSVTEKWLEWQKFLYYPCVQRKQLIANIPVLLGNACL